MIILLNWRTYNNRLCDFWASNKGRIPTCMSLYGYYSANGMPFCAAPCPAPYRAIPDIQQTRRIIDCVYKGEHIRNFFRKRFARHYAQRFRVPSTQDRKEASHPITQARMRVLLNEDPSKTILSNRSLRTLGIMWAIGLLDDTTAGRIRPFNGPEWFEAKEESHLPDYMTDEYHPTAEPYLEAIRSMLKKEQERLNQLAKMGYTSLF